MSENLVSTAITSAILLAMLVFVPCLELTARGCKRINRSLWRAGNQTDGSTTESLNSALESPTRTNKQADSRSSNAA
jgi:hypothetical protein